MGFAYSTSAMHLLNQRRGGPYDGQRRVATGAIQKGYGGAGLLYADVDGKRGTDSHREPNADGNSETASAHASHTAFSIWSSIFKADLPMAKESAHAYSYPVRLSA